MCSVWFKNLTTNTPEEWICPQTSEWTSKSVVILIKWIKSVWLYILFSPLNEPQRAQQQGPTIWNRTRRVQGTTLLPGRWTMSFGLSKRRIPKLSARTSNSSANTWVLSFPPAVQRCAAAEFEMTGPLPSPQEIDGRALMLLRSDIIMKYMGLKLGPALKLCHHIERLKQSKQWEMEASLGFLTGNQTRRILLYKDGEQRGSGPTCSPLVVVVVLLFLFFSVGTSATCRELPEDAHTQVNFTLHPLLPPPYFLLKSDYNWSKTWTNQQHLAVSITEKYLMDSRQWEGMLEKK